MPVPPVRIQECNESPVRPDGQYVLYWMTACRRCSWNFSLDHAIDLAVRFGRPLLILEALGTSHRWASDRLHRFVIRGMADNAAAFARHPVTYFPWLETQPGEGQGLLERLATDACVVVTDDFPGFFLPRMLSAVAPRLHVRLEAVDSNGVLPMRATDRVFSRAHDFRRFLQKHLPPYLDDAPRPYPFRGRRLTTPIPIPADVTRRWPVTDIASLADTEHSLNRFAIDHSVAASPTQGGPVAARKRLGDFCRSGLPRYLKERNQPESDVSSGLSPYLHFGHISAHEVFARVMRDESWTPGRLSHATTGSATGWWGCRPETESFLDELITWRELGYNMSWQRDDCWDYGSLPQWALNTLSQHADDARPQVYSLQQFESATTHSALWNAAQTQLVREGRIHNYLRMLWGKKILHWSASPQAALRIMIELNNKYALDGRDPNSCSGIFWVLGRYDRAWGPERTVFGKVRYMTCDNTARKVRVRQYIRDYSAASE